MKKYKRLINSIRAIIMAAIFLPFFSAQAGNVESPVTLTGAAEFQNYAGGKCIYYVGGGCSRGGWFANPKSNCDWEPCCQKQYKDYPSSWWGYQFKNACNEGTFSWGIEKTYPDKSLCLNANFDCCCPTPPPAKTTTPTTPTKEAPKFTMPEFQVPIDTVKLSATECTTDTDGNYHCSVPWIGQYILGLYNYGLSIAGILAAIILMAGGVLWLISGGDASRITQAKELIVGSIVGLIILASSFILLTQINPNLVRFQSISIGAINPSEFQPVPSDTNTFSANCKPQDTGACAVANMAIFKDKASQASAICNAESGGNASIHNELTKCTGGEYAVWGLFQFNLSANNFIDAKNNVLKCPTAFNKVWTNSSPSCTVVNKDLYDQCIAAATNASLSIMNAYVLASNSKTTWGPWESNSKWCHF